MILLTNKKDWKKWMVDALTLDIKDTTYECPKFPCYGYAVVCSWAFEEEMPRYLSLEQLELMTSSLIDAKRKSK